MLGGMGNQSQNGNGFGMDKLMSMMSILGTLGGKPNTQNNNGLDLMKILPLITAMKGGNLAGMMGNVGTSSVQKNEESSNTSPPQPEKQKSYKDTYSAISFAGNEVIYTLGKLWKIKK